MSILQRYYNRSFGDYYTMRACRAASDEAKEWGNDKIAIEEKHRAWIYEPLLEQTHET